ncbi:LOW QUALITY PROTEIN: coiled-coil domain-containing protein 150-like [Amphiura filiformis]|uniref:LOW QUALITY PROTEIN: coiled-coil domain-containing protein 150-like n=1 Tax=Amphiura filiformis TaxID=82378 RepID=UPI003B212CCC
MSRSTIPPGRTKARPGSPGSKTLHLLQKKLQTAEAETMSLVRQLSDMGFQQQPPGGLQSGRATRDGAGERRLPKGNTREEPVAPFLPRNAESSILHKSYEAMVSRVCRTESQIQTLKLNLCTLQAEKDLNGDEAGKLKETLAQIRESHEQEVKKLNREIVLARKEWKDTREARNTAEEEVRRLTSALELATNTKSELAIEYEEFKTTKGKLNRRIAELREELAREVSLRTSLEDSHSTLLNRIQEMENVVESERKEVQILAQDCSQLHREGIRVQEEKNHAGAARAYQMQLEQTVHRLKSESGDKEVKLTEVLEENKVLGANLSGLKREIVSLHKEMEQLQGEHNKLQKLHAALQAKERRKSTEMSSQGIVNAELQKLKDANEITEQKRKELEMELTNMKTSYIKQADDYKEQIQLLESTVEELRTVLMAMQNEREGVIIAKENLLDEVNQAVDNMSDERTRLQEQLHQAQRELSVIGDDKQQLQQENNRLIERIAAAEQQQLAQHKVEASLSEMLESKNRLAYEKGNLQSQVSELQLHLTTLATTQAELKQLKNTHATLQMKYNKTNNDLSQIKMDAQRLERQLKQEQSNCQMKEHDFRLAIQARDEALKETQVLRNQMTRAEEREKQQVVSLQQCLSDAKVDQGKIASTLDGVMGSHQQLQHAAERLQTELGRKDSELKSLKLERCTRQQTTDQLQREVEQLQAKLVAIETDESDQIHAFQTEISALKEDKMQLGLTLDELIQTNGQLQAAVEKQRNDLEKKSYEYQLLQQARADSIITKDSDKITEYQHLRKALGNCGYQDWAINKALNKDNTKTAATSSNQARGKLQASLSHTTVTCLRNSKEFTDHGITTHFKPTNTIRQSLVHPKDKQPKGRISGVVSEMHAVRRNKPVRTPTLEKPPNLFTTACYNIAEPAQVQTNGQLQAAVEKQRNDLEMKSYEYQLLQQARSEDKKSVHDVQEEYEERLAKLRDQVLSRKQAGNKRLQRELVEVKGQNEMLNCKLVDMTRNNTDLEKKLSKFEESISKQTNRIRSQKTQLEHYHHMKKTNEESSSKMAAIQQRLVEMEKANKEYVAKNREQAKTITSFVTQMKKMEKELKAVSQAQQEMSSHSKKREVEVYKERGKQQESFPEKTARLELEVSKLKEERDRAEEKLLEISNESVQISSSLEEAHTWFKTRYDALQQELAQSKERQNQLELINTKQQHQIAAERSKSTEQSLKAKSMIRSSREALSRVADQAEIHHLETKTQMRSMTYRLQAEKDHSSLTDKRIHKILNSSAQYIEDLTVEMDDSRTQNTQYS